MTAFWFYRAAFHLTGDPLTNPLETLCAEACVDCGARTGAPCLAYCQAAMVEVWRVHGAIVGVRALDDPCGFCGRTFTCVPTFAVRLDGGQLRDYTVRHYGAMALGAFTTYYNFVHTGQWPSGGPNGASVELHHATSGGVIREQVAG